MFVSYYLHKFLKFYVSQTKKKSLNSRSNHQKCFIEKPALKNFAIFFGKHLCQCLLLILCQASRPATLLKRESNTGVPVNIAQFLTTLILKKICEQLLLPFLLLTVNISSQGLVSALNSISPLQRSSSRFKEFYLGCLVVGSSLI